MTHHIDIYTDGACSCNPGKGGAAWLTVADYDGTQTVLRSGHAGVKFSTSNRMEIIAAILGIRDTRKLLDDYDIDYSDSVQITVRTDSEILYGTMTKGYKRRANGDLWEQLDKAIEECPYPVRFEKVPGHHGDKYNELVDQAAVAARLRPDRELRNNDTELLQDSEPDHRQLDEQLLDEYRSRSGVCAAEFLAGKSVPAGVSFEKAFQAYISLLKTVEGDRFIQVREKETVEL